VEHRIKALRPGVDVGSLISAQPIERLERMLDAATKQGAKIVTGGKRFDHPDRPHAAYFQPTLVVDATMEMDIVGHELFAPVMTVLCYDSIDEAVDILNTGRYGLGASVFGNNKRQCQQVAGRLQCGMVSINE
jgi:acyl-CoA reductase-like NAD-dependent aldehyde dehydrogenase